jgi:hypothetical protein
MAANVVRDALKAVKTSKKLIFDAFAKILLFGILGFRDTL